MNDEPENPKKPIIRNRASIIHTELGFTVLWRNQLNPLIDFLVANDYSFEWLIERGDSKIPDSFTLYIHDVPWSDNVIEIMKIAKECDYQQD